MALLTTNSIIFSGLNTESVYVAAAAEQTFANTGREFLHIKNASGSPITCTITTTATTGGLAVADNIITVGATTGEQMAGPFLPGVYSATGTITWSATTSVTVAVFQLP